MFQRDTGPSDRHIRVSRVALARWLVLLMLGALVLDTAGDALAHRRYGRVNNVVGPLGPQTRVGQTFVSRYAGLSGIEVQIGTYGRGSNPDKATLLLHVRAAPGAGPDLATAVLAPWEPVGENAWHTFTFPPIEDSQDKTLYFEVESPDATGANALALYWWLPAADVVTDAYAGGQASVDGAPSSADLAFGLVYKSIPIEAFAQVARAASEYAPVAALLMASAILGAIFVFAAVFQRQRTDRRTDRPGEP